MKPLRRRDGLKYLTFEFDMNTDLSIKLKYYTEYNDLEQTFILNPLLNKFYRVVFQQPDQKKKKLN